MIGSAYLLTTALLLAGCLQVNSERWVEKRDKRQIRSSHRFNIFDLDLLKLATQAQPGNVLVSPVSVKATLAMLLEGAGGKSADEIRSALRITDNPDAMRKLFLEYLSSFMNQNPGQKIALSNRVFVANTLKINPRYAKSLQKNYHASVVNVDFSRPRATAEAINSWVQNVTNNLVPSLVEPASIQGDSQILLANAIYFKGKWLKPFDTEGTTIRCFYTSAGVCREASMMETVDEYNYGYIEDLDAYALELPYEGNQFSMVVVMPKSVEGITQLVRDIGHVQLHTIISSLQMTEVLISIPRFEIEFSTDLVHILSELGMREIFSPFSNLTGLFEGTTQTAQVSNFFHKAKIVVNEEGSEAGAGTGALVIPLMGSIMPKFTADRPFLFFIRDKTTGVVLFAGRVSEPEAVKVPPTEDENIDSVFRPTNRPTTTRRNRPYPIPTTAVPERRPSTTAAPERKPTPTAEGTDYYRPNPQQQTQYPSQQNSNSQYTNTLNVKTVDNQQRPNKPSYADVANFAPNSDYPRQVDSQNNRNVAHTVLQREGSVYSQPKNTPNVEIIRSYEANPLSIQPSQTYTGGTRIISQYSGASSYGASNRFNENMRETANVAQIAPTNSPRSDAPQPQQDQQRVYQNNYNSNTGPFAANPPQTSYVAAVTQGPVFYQHQPYLTGPSNFVNERQRFELAMNISPQNPVVMPGFNYNKRQIPNNYNDQYESMTNQRNLQANQRTRQLYEPAADAQARSYSGQRTNLERTQGDNRQGIVYPSR